MTGILGFEFVEKLDSEGHGQYYQRDGMVAVTLRIC
jgi:hypothetical protein